MKTISETVKTLAETGNGNSVEILLKLFSWVLQLLVTANVLSSPILFTVMVVAIPSSETSVLTRTTRRHIPEYCILRPKGISNFGEYIPATRDETGSP
jgi:hypothetical protein